jgi:hypothetical protein
VVQIVSGNENVKHLLGLQIARGASHFLSRFPSALISTLLQRGVNEMAAKTAVSDDGNLLVNWDAPDCQLSAPTGYLLI